VLILSDQLQKHIAYIFVDAATERNLRTAKPRLHKWASCRRIALTSLNALRSTRAMCAVVEQASLVIVNSLYIIDSL
jgi:hypothetical protein